MTSTLMTDPPRWRRINALLQEALTLPQDQHDGWLDQLAGQQSDVLPMLRVLLARHAVETDSFMSRPVAGLWPKAMDTNTLDDEQGQIIGPYRLLRLLGTGGMGTVWLAQRVDASPQRLVAVKLPLRGWARGVTERLKQERDTLAGLEHPNIARLYDAGVTPAGRPYLAMEFVDGIPIDAFATQHSLTVRDKLALFQQVANAVAYAHGRLVVHRDLKPSNILVTRNGEVRLLDFGAAKLLRDEEAQSSALTRELGRALSPDYASPEQIQGESITVACDVYSLGIVLFELLTGRRPYKLKRYSTAALQASIVGADVPLPSSVVTTDRQLSRELRGDLDNIVAKALKKFPQERYGTVSGFADDVRRWLKHEPVSAQRDSTAYRLGKFVRRNRLAVSAVALVFAAVVVSATVTTAEMLEARKQRDEARVQAKHAQAQERYANMVMEQFGPGGQPLTREEMTDRSVDILYKQYSDDPRFIAEALIPISDRYMELGNTDKELAVLQRADAIARRLGDSALVIEINCYLVETELDKGRIENAEKRLNEARALLADNPNAPMRQRIDCMHADATLADARGDRIASVDRIEAAIVLQERDDPTDRNYRALLSHAQVLYLYAGRPKEAYATVEKTLEVLKKTDAQNGEAISGSIHNRSLALNQMGEVRAAIESERDAIAITTGNNPSRLVMAPMAQALGRMYARMNHAAEAEVWSERALSGAREGGNIGSQILDLATLAEANERAGHVAKASANAAEAAHLLLARNDPRERAAVARAEASIALGRKDLRAARTAAAAMLDALGYPDAVKVRASQSSDVLLLLAARIALEAGDFPSASQLASDALELSRSLARDPEHSATVGEARLLLAQVQYAQGKTADARTSIRGAAAALSAGLASDHPLVIEAAGLEVRL
jgi:serine/threonine protein kinase/tetratricopeptide (TPR) repeat protein